MNPHTPYAVSFFFSDNIFGVLFQSASEVSCPFNSKQ